MGLRALYKRASVVALVSTVVLVPLASRADEAVPTDSGGACIMADKCCRVCSTGKACGNSCIQASKTCHKGRGCACNEAEICSGS